MATTVNFSATAASSGTYYLVARGYDVLSINYRSGTGYGRAFRDAPNVARDGAAVILSSHLLSLLEEVCSHVMILQAGRKVADGSMARLTVVDDGCGFDTEHGRFDETHLRRREVSRNTRPSRLSSLPQNPPCERAAASHEIARRSGCTPLCSWH